MYTDISFKERSSNHLYSNCAHSSLSTACTAERFFRIDRAQEHLHYVTDICTEDLFVLDPELTDPTSLGGVRGDVR